ncbi:hypothetical protein L363_05090 [Klebsiella pneumoniae MGH 17]|nr:hypothetical protein L363_05090 [Klebsiella pneumoniae MGH 17]
MKPLAYFSLVRSRSNSRMERSCVLSSRVSRVSRNRSLRRSLKSRSICRKEVFSKAGVMAFCSSRLNNHAGTVDADFLAGLAGRLRPLCCTIGSGTNFPMSNVVRCSTLRIAYTWKGVFRLNARRILKLSCLASCAALGSSAFRGRCLPDGSTAEVSNLPMTEAVRF